MSFDPKYTLAVKHIMDSLDSAVSDWITIDGGDPTDIWIVTVSGLAFCLADIPTIPEISVTGIKLTFKGVVLNVPIIQLSLLSWILKFGDAMHVPGSQHWLFGGPLRENVWPPKPGDDPIFSEVQYYTTRSGLIDGASLILVISIGYALTKIGLLSLASRFFKKIFTNNTTAGSDEVQQSLTDISDKASNMMTALYNNDVPLLTQISQLAGIAGVLISAYNTAEHIFNAAIPAETTQNIIDILADVETIQLELDENLNKLNEWLIYLDDLSSWLANPIGRFRPERPSV